MNCKSKFNIVNFLYIFLATVISWGNKAEAKSQHSLIAKIDKMRTEVSVAKSLKLPESGYSKSEGYTYKKARKMLKKLDRKLLSMKATLQQKKLKKSTKKAFKKELTKLQKKWNRASKKLNKFRDTLAQNSTSNHKQDKFHVEANRSHSLGGSPTIWLLLLPLFFGGFAAIAFIAKMRANKIFEDELVNSHIFS